MSQLSTPPAVQIGDRVAIVSPSTARPASVPHVHELSMQRLRDELGLLPVEYPTTRRLGASAEDRAADLMAAFADPDIRAVLATIGGDDQITVLPYLDPAVVLADPKPFLGYSDNTNLLAWLAFHGIVGYHGGSTLVHLGRAGSLNPVTLESLRHSLFGRGTDVELPQPALFGEDEIDWYDPASLTVEPPMRAADPWVWHQPDRIVTGRTWGGNLEIVQWLLGVDRWVRPVDGYAGCVLLLETSEEMPAAEEVFRILRTMGERGLLGQFGAVVVGRAKASTIGAVRSDEGRATYRQEQRAAILRALATYNPDAVVVFNVDIGHTDPQLTLPYGGLLTVDGPARKVIAHY